MEAADWMNELDVVKYLLQTGAAGILIIAGAGMLRFLREERADRAAERTEWFSRMNELTTGIRELTQYVTEALRVAREAAGQSCPFTGASQETIMAFEERMKRRRPRQ